MRGSFAGRRGDRIQGTRGEGKRRAKGHAPGRSVHAVHMSLGTALAATPPGYVSQIPNSLVGIVGSVRGQVRVVQLINDLTILVMFSASARLVLVGELHVPVDKAGEL